MMQRTSALLGSAEESYAKESLERTTRWLERAVKVWSQPHKQSLFGIVQGGTL